MKAKEAIGTGVLRAGKLQWDDQAGFSAELRGLEDGSVVVTVKHASAATVRSQKANKYYFGVVLRIVSEETGQSVDDIHDAMCSQFLPSEQKRVEFFNRMTGESLAVDADTRRSSKLTGGPFYDFVEQVRLWAQEFLGIQTPDPDPEYWRKRERKAA